jgi:acyl dehydratase
VHVGDVLSSVQRVTEIRDVGRNELMTLVTDVRDAQGRDVATCTMSLVSRGTAAPKEA